tara:strand:- start:20898 stop:24236 length:3339 start_codon:yes stop_codon:yes gene_type:complete
MPNVVKKNAADQLGTSTKLWAEVHATAIYEAGVRVATVGTRLDELAAAADNTTLDATVSAHGLMPKASVSKLADIEAGAQVGDGDMQASTYDPNTVAGDAFALANMTGTVGASQLADASIALAKLADITTARMLGRVAVGSGVTQELTAANVRTLINVEDGAAADQTGSEIKAAYEGEADTNAFTDAAVTKLGGIESLADVTTPTNVTASGALMDSEVTNLADVKAFATTDYATAAQGTLADSATQPADLGTAALLDVGTTANLVVQLDGTARLPAVDGSQLTGLPGGGDMAAATYDPTTVSGDAFDMDNMVEGTTTKILTATERTKLSGIETSATADQTGAEIRSLYEAEPGVNPYSTSEAITLSNVVSDVADLGTAAALDVGTTANLVVQLNASAELPAVSGANLTNLPIGALAATSSDMLSTGIVSGGAITINGGDNTKFDVAAGVGIIVDSTTSPPTVTDVSWSAFSAQTLTNLATSFATDIAINSAGSIVQQNSYTDEEVRSVIILGGVDHNNQTSISGVFEITAPVKSVASGLREFARAIGDVNLSGNTFSANGANLNIDKSAGTVFSYGRNFLTNVDSPHKLTTALDTAISFNYVFNNGSGSGSFTASTTSINPDSYDNGTGTLASVSTNDFTIQRLLLFPNTNKTFVQYGVDTYNKLNDALDAVPRAQFIALAGIKTAIVRGYLIVQQGETDLTNSTFLGADRLGNVASSSSGINSTLADLTDVTITSIASGELLKWNGSAWINNTIVEAGLGSSAQGALADSATQPGDSVTTLGSGAATDGHVATSDGAGNIVFEAVPAGATVDVVSNVATSTILGRATAGSGDSEELTPAGARTLIGVDAAGTDNSDNNAANTTYSNDYRAANFVSGTDYEPAKGADDNFVTDAEKIVVGNTSGTNTGDQDLSGYALTSSLGTAGVLDVGTTANLVVQLNASAELPAVSGANLTSLPDSAPVGLVGMYAVATPPAGWLETDGSTISRTTYSDLFAIIGTVFGAGDGSTTFEIPDMRGEFPRGWDNGRGTDSGRVFGSAQDHAIEDMTGVIQGAQENLAGSGVFTSNSSIAGSRPGNGSATRRSVSFDPSNQINVDANETRPTNIALLFCIKY